jgi:anti-anti-sigma regulatory factor
VVVDLTSVDILTTPAISMFIAAAKTARESGGAITFTESPPPVRDILNRLRLHSILHTVSDVRHAIDEMRMRAN